MPGADVANNYEEQPLFLHRADAGVRPAEKLQQYQGGEVVVLAIPRGGVPVAIDTGIF